MKTNELTGAALDWAVAKCAFFEGKTFIALRQESDWLVDWYDPAYDDGCQTTALPKYSTDWAQGGPIIEREKIDMSVQFYGWVAHHGKYRGKEMNQPYHTHKADTPLIAAMRCFVASKLGDDVDVPEELLKPEKQ